MVRIYKHDTAPESLAKEQKKKSGRYNLPDVSEQLVHDGADKCYICETSVTHGYQIEHQTPHHGGDDRALKFSWDNLQLSCPHCNSVKNQPKYEKDLLNCCKTDPEQQICQRIRMSVITVTPRSDSPEAVNTADLIRECLFTNATYQKGHNSAARRRDIKLQTIRLCKSMRRYRSLRATRAPDDPERQASFREVCMMINSKAAYAAFLRTFVRDRLDDFPEFTEYVGPWTEQTASATGGQE